MGRMAVSQTARMALTRWSAGTDPFTRAQLDDDMAQLEAKAAGFLRGTLAARPAAAAANIGFIYETTDTRTLYWSTGTAWVDLNLPEFCPFPGAYMRRPTLVIGQATTSGTTLQTLYTVPAGKKAMLTGIGGRLNSGSQTSFTLHLLRGAGEAASNDTAVTGSNAYNILFPPSQTTTSQRYEFDIPIVLEAGDRVATALFDTSGNITTWAEVVECDATDTNLFAIFYDTAVNLQQSDTLYTVGATPIILPSGGMVTVSSASVALIPCGIIRLKLGGGLSNDNNAGFYIGPPTGITANVSSANARNLRFASSANSTGTVSSNATHRLIVADDSPSSRAAPWRGLVLPPGSTIKPNAGGFGPARMWLSAIPLPAAA